MMMMLWRMKKWRWNLQLMMKTTLKSMMKPAIFSEIKEKNKGKLQLY